MATPASVTRRPRPVDDGTRLQRLVADSLAAAVIARGTTVAQWQADVDRLQAAVDHLAHLHRHAAGETETAAAREQVSLAMLMVMPVYAAAQAQLSETLALPVNQALATVRRQLSTRDLELVDRWLARSITDAVHDLLESRVRRNRQVPAA